MSTFLKQPLTLCLSLLTLSFTTSDSRALNFYDGWNLEALMQSLHFFFSFDRSPLIYCQHRSHLFLSLSPRVCPFLCMWVCANFNHHILVNLFSSCQGRNLTYQWRRFCSYGFIEFFRGQSCPKSNSKPFYIYVYLNLCVCHAYTQGYANREQ